MTRRKKGLIGLGVLVIIFIIATAVTSCHNDSNQEETTKQTETTNPVSIEVTSVQVDAGVEVTGEHEKLGKALEYTTLKSVKNEEVADGSASVDDSSYDYSDDYSSDDSSVSDDSDYSDDSSSGDSVSSDDSGSDSSVSDDSGSSSGSDKPAPKPKERKVGYQSEKNVLSKSKVNFLKRTIKAELSGSEDKSRRNIARYMTKHKITSASKAHKILTGHKYPLHSKTYKCTMENDDSESLIKVANKAIKKLKTGKKYGLSVSSFYGTIGYKLYMTVVYK